MNTAPDTTDETNPPGTFVHLHVHSAFSLLDGFQHTAAMVAKAKNDGMPALAITDHGSLGGTWKFAHECRKHGIKPILGIEAYLAVGGVDRFNPTTIEIENDMDVDGGDTAKTLGRKTKRYEHLTILAATAQGWRNLVRINNESQNSFYNKPLMDFDLIKAHSEGLIVLTGCLGGPVAGPLARGDHDLARHGLEQIIDAVGAENVYVEMMYHHIPAEKSIMRDLRDLADEYGLEVVVTGDCHYTHAEDSITHEVWLADQSGRTLDDPKAFRFNGSGYHLMTPAEIRDLFPTSPTWQRGCDNTVAIAERIDDWVLPEERIRLPKFPLTPDGVSEADYLRDLVEAGARRKYGTVTAEIADRIDFELQIINDMGYPGYFLIVWEMIGWARDNGILVGPGRGSAAGALTAYALDITDIEPLSQGLLFERFLEPGRVGMPDIDTDFEQARIPDILAHLRDLYGHDRVAQLGTFAFTRTKAALKNSAKVLGNSALGQRMSNLVPSVGGKPVPFKTLLHPADAKEAGFGEALRQLVDPEDTSNYADEARQVLRHAVAMEDMVRNWGIHACGVIVSAEPLLDLVPMRKLAPTAADTVAQVDKPWITVWDGPDCEQLGLLKLDALSLRNLDVARLTVQLIAEDTGTKVDLYDLDPDDADDPKVTAAYTMLGEGRTAGVFQMECVAGSTRVGGTTIRSLFRLQNEGRGRARLKAASFDDGSWRNVPVLRVVASGIKDTFRLVTETGRCIEATAGHRFMTDNGWKKLGELSVGDRVVTDTRAKMSAHRLCKDCGTPLNYHPGNVSDRCYRCSARFHSNPTCSKEQLRTAALRTFAEGRIVWNKGVTAESDERQARAARNCSKALIGRSYEDLSGPERAAERRKKMSARMSGQKNHMFGVPSPNGKRGFRDDLGHYVRSTWEADFARVLNYQGKPYEYEPETFLLVDPDTGKKLTYTPDFYIPSEDRWVEVKGFMRWSDARKIELFRQQYPEHDLFILNRVEFAELAMTYKNLVAWECPVMPSGAAWETVEQIISVGEQETFDIALAGPAHNYIANGFVVHNSGGMADLAAGIQPHGLNDLTALGALYRPGPMAAGSHTSYAARKRGDEPVRYKGMVANRAEAAVIDSVLGATYGLMAYQEQVMQLAGLVAGFDAKERSKLRKAMGKKDPAAMAESNKLFYERGTKEIVLEDGTVSIAFEQQSIDNLLDMIRGAGSYLFNRSHAAAYGKVTFWTAWLKANFPAHFAAATLAVTKDPDRRAAALNSLARDGVTLLPPDVNSGRVDTHVVDAATIRLGLAEIGQMQSAAEHIARVRNERGPFTSLSDLADGVVLDVMRGTKLSSSQLVGLIESGACDSLTDTSGGVAAARARMIAELHAPVGGRAVVWSWSVLEAASRQRDRVGLALGEHPMVHHADDLARFRIPAVDEEGAERHWPRTMRVGQMLDRVDDPDRKPLETATVMGVLVGWSTRPYSKGTMANWVLEDADGRTLSGAMFDRDLRTLAEVPTVGQIVTLHGRVNVKTVKHMVTGEDGEEAEVESRRVEVVADQVWTVPVGASAAAAAPAASPVVWGRVRRLAGV